MQRTGHLGAELPRGRRGMLDDSGAVGWGARAVSPGKGRGSRGAACWVERGREGGVFRDSRVSGLGNRVAGDAFQIRTSG